MAVPGRSRKGVKLRSLLGVLRKQGGDTIKDLVDDQFTATILESTFNQTWPGVGDPDRTITVTGFIVDKGLEGFFLHAFQRRGQGNDGSAAEANSGFIRLGMLKNDLTDPTLDLAGIVTGGHETTRSVPQTGRIAFFNTDTGGAIVRTVVDPGNLKLVGELDIDFIFARSNFGVLPDITGMFLTPNDTVGNHAALNQLFAIMKFDPVLEQDSENSDGFVGSVITGTLKIQFEILT